MLNCRTSPEQYQHGESVVTITVSGSHDDGHPCRNGVGLGCTDASRSWTRRLWPELISVPSRKVPTLRQWGAALAETSTASSYAVTSIR